MSAIHDDFGSFRFTTRDVSPAQRFPMWYEVFGRSVSRRTLALTSDRFCHVDMTVRSLGCAGSGVRIQRMAMSGGVIARRTPELLEDGNDDFILHVHESGRRIVSQCGREAAIEAGGGLLTSNADPSAIILPDRTRFASIGLPRSLTKTLAPGIEDALVRPLPAEAGILRLLMRYLDLLDDPDAVATPDLRRAAAAHIHDLCALAIGASREVKELAAGRGLRAARLHAIKEDIARNLHGDDLSAEFLAKRQRVTPRYIHKLFESEGLTLSQFVLSQRLVKVHRALMDPRHAGETIGAIAFGAGFGDLSTFNRAFRRRFGATPSDVRAAARS